MPSHRTWRAPALLAVLLLAAGCSATSSGATPSPTSTPSAPAPTTATTTAAVVTGPAQTLRNLSYAETSQAQKLDLYLPERTGRAVPLVINIHGGGWMEGDKRDQPERWNVERLNADGIAVAGINYRLSGEARFPAGVQDAKASIRWLRANADRYGIDPDRFALSGASAGGHIAALLGVTGSLRTEFDGGGLGNPGVSASVRAVVSLYGVTDMLTMDQQSQAQGICSGPYPMNDLPNSPESVWLGYPIQERPAETRKAGPISYLRRATKVPPFFLIHGTADCTVPDAQSQELKRALRRKGVPVHLQLVDGAGHGDPRIFQQGSDAAIAFLEKALR